MTIGFVFWFLMLLWVIASFGVISYPNDGPYRRHWFGGWAILAFVLFFLLGWEVFGFVIQHGPAAPRPH